MKSETKHHRQSVQHRLRLVSPRRGGSLWWLYGQHWRMKNDEQQKKLRRAKQSNRDSRISSLRSTLHQNNKTKQSTLIFCHVSIWCTGKNSTQQRKTVGAKIIITQNLQHLILLYLLVNGLIVSHCPLTIPPLSRPSLQQSTPFAARASQP